MWQEVIAKGEEMKEELAKKTIEFGKEPIEVTKYLSQEEEPEKADFILLFGSNSKKRVEKAWEWWQKGLASKIVITGGKPNYVEEKKMSEAEIFRDELVALGVPEDRIITENKSITIPDNIRTSFNLLDNLEVKYKSIIVVLAWFAMRRAWVHLMKYGEEGIKIYRTSAVIMDQHLSKEDWWKNELGIKTIFDQFVKLKVAEELNTA